MSSPESRDAALLVRRVVAEIFAQERISPHLIDDLTRVYGRIAQAIAGRAHDDRTLLVGICGSQGSGKSTMALVLKAMLARLHGRSVAALSLDDVYRTRAERAELARDVHPLLATRGVPGTHDMALAAATFDRLTTAAPTDQTALPAFDKASDDRAPRDSWPVVTGRPDVIVFEGWCVAARPQADAALAAPVNELERCEDAAGTWRRFVNRELATTYRPLFDSLDMLFMLRAPSFEQVFAWRREQEEKLARRLGVVRGADATHRLMDDRQLARFIGHYERLTRHILDEMPPRADILVSLGADRSITDLAIRT